MSSSSLPIPQALLDKFNTRLIKTSELEDWLDRLSGAGSDKKKLRKVLFSVLVHYSWAVRSETALKKKVLSLSDSQAREELINSLNDDEVEEWKTIVQKGDWVGLIKHRICLACLRSQYIVIRYWHSETSETS